MLPSNYYRSRRSQELTLFRSSHVLTTRCVCVCVWQATEQQTSRATGQHSNSLRYFCHLVCAVCVRVCVSMCVIHLSRHLQFLLKDLFMDSICVQRRALRLSLCACVCVCVCLCAYYKMLQCFHVSIHSAAPACPSIPCCTFACAEGALRVHAFRIL